MADQDEKFVYDEDVKLPAAPCGTCKHRVSSVFCVAFPDGDGIPNEILIGKNNHRKPYPGDHGIHYSKRKDSDE